MLNLPPEIHGRGRKASERVTKPSDELVRILGAPVDRGTAHALCTSRRRTLQSARARGATNRVSGYSER